MYLPSGICIFENLEQYLNVNLLLSGSLFSPVLHIFQAFPFEILYFVAILLNESPSRWSFSIAFLFRVSNL